MKPLPELKALTEKYLNVVGKVWCVTFKNCIHLPETSRALWEWWSFPKSPNFKS